jgi:hypothetical protein
MSEYRICRDHGYPGIMISWDNNVRSKSGRYVPLEKDRIMPHKHYESTKPIPTPNDYPNSTLAAAKTITETNTGVNWVRSINSDNKQENPTLEALTLEFHTLLKHTTE